VSRPYSPGFVTALSYDDLIAAGNAYLDALAAGDSQRVRWADGARFTENCGELALGDGLWRTAGSVPYRQLFADAASGNVGVFATVEESGVLATLGGRLRIDADGLSEAETIVTREGQSSIFAPGALVTPNPIWEERTDPAARPNRQKIASAANGYFEALQTDSTRHVTFHAECQRIENGAQTTSTPRTGNLGTKEQIDKGQFKYMRELRERRFPLVDEERGLVLGMAFIDVPGDVTSIEIDGVVRELPPIMRMPRSTLLFELFKVVEGPSVRWIEAMMINRPLGTVSGWA